MADKTWLKFVLRAVDSKRITNIWAVQTVELGLALGEIAWYTPWRRYVFMSTPLKVVILEPDCLRSLAAFCEHETTKRRAQAPPPLLPQRRHGQAP